MARVRRWWSHSVSCQNCEVVILFTHFPELWGVNHRSWGGELIHLLPGFVICRYHSIPSAGHVVGEGGDLIHFSPEQKGTSFSCLFCNIFISKRYIFIYFFLKFLFIFYEVLFQILCKYLIPAKFSYFILYIQIVIFLYFSLINFTFHLYSTVAFYCLNSFII